MVPDSLDLRQMMSSGEASIYRALQSQLPGDWLVIHSLRWVKSDGSSGRKAQGEGDFIAFCPRLGIVVIEVKGGGIRCEAGRWYSTDALGQRHDIQDPEKQASDTKFELIAKLNKAGASGCLICHAVWFPDVDATSAQLPHNLRPEILLDELSLAHPLEALEGAFAYWRTALARAFPALSPQQAEAVERHLVPACDLSRTLRRQGAELNETYVRLTGTQVSLLEQLDSNPRLAVIGRAGTGKTLVALEKVRRDAALGKRALLLCFNTDLATWLRAVEPNQAIEIATVHSFALKYMKRNFAHRVLGFGGNPDFNYLMSEFAETAGGSDRYDTIVVDEAQDFRQMWLDSLESLVSPDGSIQLMYDPLQNLHRYGEDEPALSTASGAVVELRKNLRNTDEISRASLNVIGEPIDDAWLSGAHGPPPTVIVCSSHDDAARATKRMVTNLIIDQGVPYQAVTLLTVSTLESSRALKGRTYLVQPTTVRKFKGLENDFLVVVDVSLDQLFDAAAQRLLYTAISRARVQVTVIITVDSSSSRQAKDSWRCSDTELPHLIERYIQEGVYDNGRDI